MRLELNGFKARDQFVDLEQLNVITGPNGSGKSAMADALRYLALGYVPAVGRTPADTSDLMHDASLRVSLTLNDGTVLTRGLEGTGDGYKRIASTPWAPAGRTSEHEAKILEVFGRTATEIEEVLDIRTLLGATPQQRAARVASLLAAGQRPASERLAAIARATISRLVDLPLDRVPVDYLQAMPLVAERHRKALKAIAGDLEARIGAIGVAGSLEWANEQKNHHAKALTDKEAAKAEIEREIAALPKRDDDVEALERQRSALEQEVGGERRSATTARQIAESRKSAASDLKERERQYAGAKKNFDALVKTGGSAERIQHDIDHVFKCLKDINPPEVVTSLVQREDYEMAKDRYERGKKDPWAEVKNIGTILSNMRHDKIGRCGRRLLTLAKANIGSYPRAVDVALAKRKYQEAKAREAEYDKVIAEKKRLTGRREDLLQRLHDLERARASLDHAEAALAHARKRVAELPPPESNPSRLIEIEGKIRAVSARLKAIADGEALRRELKRILSGIKEAEAYRDVFVALEWALQRAREAVLAEDKPVLVERMETFFRAAGCDGTPYFHTYAGGVEFGVDMGGPLVAVSALSGGEWCLFATALTAAVISIRRPKIGILLVEAGEVDDDNLWRLLEGIRAVADGFTTAIVCTPHLPRETPVTGWNTITLE
jgi:DNA repair ATPase RecN